jgi:hypothetical protein
VSSKWGVSGVSPALHLWRFHGYSLEMSRGPFYAGSQGWLFAFDFL